MSPRGLATRPRMPAIWRTCIMFPRAPEPTIMSMGLNCLAGETSLHRLPHLVGGGGPDLDLLLAPLTVGDDAPPELLLDLVGFLLVAVEDAPLLGRRLDVVDRDGEARPGREAEAEVLDAVEAGGHLGLGVVVGQAVDDLAHLLLLDRLGDVAEAGGQALVEEDPPDGALATGVSRLVVAVGADVTVGLPQLDLGVQRDVAGLVGPLEPRRRGRTPGPRPCRPRPAR